MQTRTLAKKTTALLSTAIAAIGLVGALLASSYSPASAHEVDGYDYYSPDQWTRYPLTTPDGFGVTEYSCNSYYVSDCDASAQEIQDSQREPFVRYPIAEPFNYDYDYSSQDG